VVDDIAVVAARGQCLLLSDDAVRAVDLEAGELAVVSARSGAHVRNSTDTPSG
jgi:hypothetical protein